MLGMVVHGHKPTILKGWSRRIAVWANLELHSKTLSQNRTTQTNKQKTQLKQNKIRRKRTWHRLWSPSLHLSGWWRVLCWVSVCFITCVICVVWTIFTSLEWGQIENDTYLKMGCWIQFASIELKFLASPFRDDWSIFCCVLPGSGSIVILIS